MRLYNHETLIVLTTDQQTRLEEVASGVFRPCCGNSTAMPDCNHGMAMLGLLELMASQGATTEAMFQAAKYANAFWFPQQALEMATLLKATKNLDFANINPRAMMSKDFFSSTGFASVHQWLVLHNLLPQVSGGGNSCGV